MMTPFVLCSGPDSPVSAYLPQETHCQPCVEESLGEYNRAGDNHGRRTELGVLLGQATRMVSFQRRSIGRIFLSCYINRYIAPPPPNTSPEGNQLEATNYENSVLFLTSCFQYILVAAVFSIGPPYRKSMWTNGRPCVFHITNHTENFVGWLMFSMITLSLFNILVLLSPPQAAVVVLELMPLPASARSTLLLVVAINVVLSVIFEQMGSGVVAHMIGRLLQLRHPRRRVRDGNAYKAVER
jgi:hypothetical protein